MIRAATAALALVCGAAWAADPPAVVAKTRALEEGKMPDEPARPLVQAKCLLCHSGEYVTQQRLTEGQWQKTVEKMRKFGTPATDEEAKTMVGYLARYWTPDLPPPRVVKVPPPRVAAGK